MVIKEDGTKWACQSCLKGHRVSGCTHTDRPLQFVPKKGRPVTQCQHCRVERKKRSAHVKCDCGEKTHAHKEKCVHLRTAEAQSSDHDKKELGAVPESDESDEHTCCCHHGEKCTCSSIKKETKDDHTLHSSRSKPHLTATRSEGHLTVFANGHHKPSHRSSHDTNAPYRVHKPHPHSVHGLHAAGRRSVDSLASVEKSSKISLDHLQQMASTYQAPQASANQPTTSPVIPEPQQTYAAFTIPADSTTSSVNDDFYGSVPSTSGYSRPQMSADLVNDMSWTNFDWTSLANMDNAQPALTYASSNTISELGEHTPPDDFGSMFANQAVPGNLNETSAQLARIPETRPAFQPQINQNNRWSLPPSFWADGNMDFNQIFPAGNVGTSSSDQIQDVQSKDFGTNMSWSSNSFMPTSNPGQQALFNKNQMQWSPDMSNQQTFDFQNIPASADGSTTGFDFGQDTMDATFQQTPEDPFFGTQCAEPLDYQDFSQNDPNVTWPS